MRTNDRCLDCDSGFFNFDGNSCLACPVGGSTSALLSELPVLIGSGVLVSCLDTCLNDVQHNPWHCADDVICCHVLCRRTVQRQAEPEGGAVLQASGIFGPLRLTRCNLTSQARSARAGGT